MATDIYKGVLFNDGEALTTEDLNEMQRFAQARLNDQLLGNLVGDVGASITPYSGTAIRGAPDLYCLRAGAGFLKGNATVLQATCAAGTIFQSVAAANGAEAQLLSYTLVDNEFALTLAAADPTNPRIDVIEVKLEYVDNTSESRDFEDDTTELLSSVSQNKAHRVQATFQIKQGTPGATPAFPTLTAGYSSLGAIRVPATYAGVVTSAMIVDTRLPLRVSSVITPASEMAPVSGTWTLGVVNDQTAYTCSVAGAIIVPCPIGRHQRLLGLDVEVEEQTASSGAFSAARLERSDFNSTSAMGDVFAALAFGGAGSGRDMRSLSYNQIRTAVSAARPASANAAGLGYGLWGCPDDNGGGVVKAASVTSWTQLGLRLTVSVATCRVFRVRWYFAE